MRALVYLGLIAWAALTAAPLWAGQATVSWTNPTTYADGSALVAADLASTTVEYGTCNGSAFAIKAGQVIANGAATSAVIVNLTPGTWCFRAASTVIAAKGGGTSTFSNVASKSVAFPNPSPPTILDVIIAFIKRLFGHFA
jgi:hypothetical protein